MHVICIDLTSGSLAMHNWGWFDAAADRRSRCPCFARAAWLILHRKRNGLRDSQLPGRCTIQTWLNNKLTAPRCLKYQQAPAEGPTRRLLAHISHKRQPISSSAGLIAASPSINGSQRQTKRVIALPMADIGQCWRHGRDCRAG